METKEYYERLMRCFRRNLYREILAAGYKSMHEFCVMNHMADSTLTRWFQGKRYPSLETIIDISLKLGILPCKLLNFKQVDLCV